RAFLLAPGCVLLLLVAQHLRRQGPLIPHRRRGVADRAGPVAGISDDRVLVRPGVVGHPGVLGGGVAGGAAGGRMHVPVRTCNEKGPAPPATEPKCLLEPVDLRPSTLGLLLCFYSVAQRPTDPPTRR